MSMEPFFTLQITPGEPSGAQGRRGNAGGAGKVSPEEALEFINLILSQIGAQTTPDGKAAPTEKKGEKQSDLLSSDNPTLDK